MCGRWSDILDSSEDQAHIFNIPEWTSRATLDAIGQGWRCHPEISLKVPAHFLLLSSRF
jgi:hypothetical protein